jgi:uncharacterized protein (TIGR03089 family)
MNVSTDSAGLPVPAAAPEPSLFTYVDDATGERTDLTAAALGSWAARTASLLRDECRIVAGSHIAVLLPPHWQTAAVLLGAWAAGMSVGVRGWGAAGLPVTGPAADVPVDAVFVSSERARSWLEDVPDAVDRFVLDLGRGHPLPDGYRDYLTELPAADRVTVPPMVVGPNAAATPDGSTYRQWGQLAAQIARTNGIGPGDRVLVDATEHEHPLYWLLGPLSVGASVVLCANADRSMTDARIAAEKITRVL